ncbi:hypothetical protein Ddc_13728 [Ditylenchus destructor]|nr:hypothetical protein Ddc_13728 [Ditylenchus destructor]
MSPFTDTIDPVFRNPLIVKVLCMMLSLSLLLALASAEPIFGYGISLFIALSSLGTSGFGIAIVASDLQDRVAKLQIFKYISPQFEIKWMHIQYSCSLILASFNFIGSIICGALVSHAYNNYHTYTTATFFSLTLCLAFILDALLALHIVSLEDQNEKTQIVSRQQYAEL